MTVVRSPIARAAAILAATYVAWAWVIGGVLAEQTGPTAVVYLAGAVTASAWSVAVVLLLRGTRWPRVTAARGIPALLTVAVILSSVVLLETRRALPQATFAAIFGNQMPAPYVMFHARPNTVVETPHDEFSRTGEPGRLTTNSRGFRGGEWPSGPDPSQLRVVFLGGSSVFLGSTDDRTVASLTAQALEARLGRPVLAINAGIGGANSTQELVLLQTEIVDLRPDIVVVLDGFNDLYGPLWYDPRVGYPYNQMVVERAWESYTTTDNVLVRLFRSSRLVARVRELFQGGPERSVDGLVLGTPTDDASIDAMAAQAADLHARNWEKMAAICRSVDAQCLLALQPTKLHPKHQPAGVTERPAVRAYRVFLERREREIQKGEPRAAGVTSVSLADLFAGGGVEAFLDGVHLYDDANAILAGSLAGALCGMDRLRSQCR